MTDSQTPRPTLKLSLKPAILESLANKKPKQTTIIPDKAELKNVAVNKKNDNVTPAKKVSLQAPIANKSPTLPKQPQQKIDKKPKQPPKKLKEKIPPPVLIPYDFFEVYSKLHADFREVISLKTPAALAIGIDKDIRQATGLSKKNNKMWIAEYLRRSQYYKKAHVAGANRYNLQGEVVGVITQEECDARQEMFENFKKKPKKAEQSPEQITL